MRVDRLAVYSLSTEEKATNIKMHFPTFSSLLHCCAVDDGNWGRSGRAVAVHVMSNSIEGIVGGGQSKWGRWTFTNEVCRRG